MDWFAKIVNRITGIFIVIGACFLIGAMLLMVGNIAYRFFGGAIPGTYELVGPLVSVTAALALGYTQLTKGHVVMDIVLNFLPQRIQIVLQHFSSVISLGFIILLAWRSVELMWQRLLLGEETIWLKVPLFPFRGFWVLGLIIFCLVLFAELLGALRVKASK